MAKLLIDANYYGNIMRCARQHLRISVADAAALLKMSKKDYQKCERGDELFSEGTLRRFYHGAFALLIIKRSRANL
ncbi:MAG: CRISPR-associated endonuclease Cas1 [Alphaproteobacteria bacterium]|nr:CRISPR-associated endonuclease Cas1 [Alphaproteobacteria bacterium]